MAWYKNQRSRIAYVKVIPEQRPPKTYFKNVYDNYVAIKESVSKTENKVTCTRCGASTEINKSDSYYLCKCGQHHSNFKNKRYKNHHHRLITLSIHSYNEYRVEDFYLTYYTMNKDTKVIDITSRLIAREIYVPEKGKTYHYNFGYQHLMSYYQKPVYSYRKNISESIKSYYRYNTVLDADNEYYTQSIFDNEVFKYIDTTDINLVGWDLGILKRNVYLIEILQKYDSSYLLQQLKDTRSNKLIDLFDMRDSGLSNKQVVMVIKYFSKIKNLNINIYKDYLDDLRFFNEEINDESLCNSNYLGAHNFYMKKRNSISNAQRDEKIQQAYDNFSEINENGIYILFPNSSQDLIDEGNALNHCVGTNGYDKKIANGKSLIFFVRKDLEQPYITAEIKNGKITQFYGKNNHLENISDVFIKQAKRELLQLYKKGATI